MPTISITVLHPTDSTKKAEGPAEANATLRDVCVDLQHGGFLGPQQQLDQLGATLERTNATLPMGVAIGQLGIQDGDAIALYRQAEGA